MRSLARRPPFRRLQRLGLAAVAVAGVAVSFDAVPRVWHRLRYTPLDVCTVAPAFAFDEGRGTAADVPERYRRLDGRAVSVEGDMVLLDQSPPFTNFVVTPSFTGRPDPWPGAAVQQCVHVSMPAGRSTPLIWPEQTVVDGTLRVRVEREDGFLISVFHVDPDAVRPATAFHGRWQAWTAGGGLLWAALARTAEASANARRARAGRCRRCGYDLRASPVRCPECGTAGVGGRRVAAASGV